MNKTNRILALSILAFGALTTTNAWADECLYEPQGMWSGGNGNATDNVLVQYNCYTDSSHSSKTSSTMYHVVLPRSEYSASLQDDGSVLITSNDGSHSYTLDTAPIYFSSTNTNGNYTSHNYSSSQTLYDENHNAIGTQYSYSNMSGEVVSYINQTSYTNENENENEYTTSQHYELVDTYGNVIETKTVSTTYNNGILTTSLSETTNANGIVYSLYSTDYYENGKTKNYTSESYFSDGTMKSSYKTEYAENGSTLHSENQQYNEDGSFKSGGRTDKEYYEDGVTQKAYTYQAYGADGVLTNSYTYEYYEDGSTTKAYSRDYFDANGNKTSSYEYEYYEDGKTKNYNSESYFPDGSVRYSWFEEYDENGKRTHNESLNYNADGTFNYSYSRDYTFDENGRQIAYDQENFDALGNKIGTAEYRENYDEDGNWLGNSYVEKDLDGNQTYAYDSVHTETDDYYADTYTEYDANGAVTNKEIDRYDYDEFGNEVWSWEQYDGNGNLLERDEDKYDDDGNYLGWTANYYTYDENGNVIGREFEDYTDLHDENGNYIGQKKLAYVYDEDGNLMQESESIYQKDANGNWGWSTISTKTYDKNGNLRSITDANGVTTRYDKHGNPIVTKKIYTVEEATRVSKPTGNKITLRYK